MSDRYKLIRSVSKPVFFISNSALAIVLRILTPGPDRKQDLRVMEETNYTVASGQTVISEF